MKNVPSGKKKSPVKLQSIEEFFDLADDDYDDDIEKTSEKKTPQIKIDRNGKAVNAKDIMCHRIWFRNSWFSY